MKRALGAEHEITIAFAFNTIFSSSHGVKDVRIDGDRCPRMDQEHFKVGIGNTSSFFFKVLAHSKKLL